MHGKWQQLIADLVFVDACLIGYRKVAVRELGVVSVDRNDLRQLR